MQELKDTQSEADTRNISIDRVGVKGLRFPIQIQDKLNRIQSTVAQNRGCTRCAAVWRWICRKNSRAPI